MAFKLKIPPSLVIITKTYLWSLFIFTLFRIILFVNELDRIEQDTSILEVLQAFIMGWRFDTVILCYILILPFVLLTIGVFFSKANKGLTLFSRYFVLLFSTIAFFISAADIPYFNHFFSRLSISALAWIDSPKFVFGMVTQEMKYWIIVLPFIFFLWFYYRRVGPLFDSNTSYKANWVTGAFTLLGLLLLVMGIRGRLAHKSPIRVGTAYFSQSPMLNQLGLNPNFTFLKSYLISKKEANKPIQLMSDGEAFALTREYLGIKTGDSLSIAREVQADTTPANPKNVVIILMESMSMAKVGASTNGKTLTPFLDSLIGEGKFYPNAYSSGIHTFNGIFSTLFSMPAIYRKHPMKGASIKEYNGIYGTLDAHDYESAYFCTHDGQFDNVSGFLTANHCEHIIAQNDYPSEEVKTTLGVPDDYMFRFAMPRVNELAAEGDPFVATFMTASDHGPYYVPPYFTPNSSDIKQQIVEYADWSLSTFFEQAKKAKWYDNTLFVLVADHGSAMDATYDMPLAFNHVPLLFYTPDGSIPASIDSAMAGQIDIYPTVMDYLNLAYQNETLGMNLNEQSRPYIYFNGDDKYGVINNEWYLVSHRGGEDALYKYRSKERTDYSKNYPDKVAEMKRYAEAQLQTYQYISNQ